MKRFLLTGHARLNAHQRAAPMPRMRRVKSGVWLITVVVAGLQANAHAQSNPPEHLLASLQEITGVPGMSAAVSEGGTIVWSGAAGMADVQHGRAVTSQTKFRLASVSKLFTAALVLQLAERNHLDLDADIQTYVPEWPDHGNAEITLRRLAAHISGIDHYSSADRYNASQRYRRLSDSISIYGHKPLMAKPGDAYSYSSYGYALIGAAVETVADQSFDAAMRTHIIEPLALNNTFLEIAAEIPPETSLLYSVESPDDINQIDRNNQRHVWGATGMLSTPSDMLIFAAAYYSSDVVGENMRNMSWTPAKLNNGSNADGGRYEVGFGWRISRDWDEQPVVHHAGVTPGARSILSLNPNTGTAVALLSNASWTSRIETTGELIATAATEGGVLRRADCPVGEWFYEGVFIESETNPPENDNARGRLEISYVNHVCQGALHTEGALAEWLADRRAPTSSMNITLVALRNIDTKIFAMASPWGAFPLRFNHLNDSAQVLGDIAGRRIALNLSPM